MTFDIEQVPVQPGRFVSEFQPAYALTSEGLRDRAYSWTASVSLLLTP